MDEKSELPDMKAVATRVGEIMGGRAKVLASMEAEHNARKERWNKDVNMIGRILRAHLHVEYYLSQYLQHENPKLDFEASRLTFGQKMNMLRENDPKVGKLVTGIKRLNAVRNRLAHNLEAGVTEEDAKVFASDYYMSMMGWVLEGTGATLSTSPIDVLEGFAEFTSSMLQAPTSPHSKAFQQAMEDVSKRKPDEDAGRS